MRTFIPLPADLADPFHPNIRWVPMPRNTQAAVDDYLASLLSTNFGCPACDHSPHPDPGRLEELRTMPYPDYLRTQEWQQTRRAKLSQVGHQCRKCGADRPLHVHHLTYDHVGHEWLDELVVLCKACHRDVHDDREDQQRHRRRR